MPASQAETDHSGRLDDELSEQQLDRVTGGDLKTFFQTLSTVLKAQAEVSKSIAANLR